jgi:hypothetical protein
MSALLLATILVSQDGFLGVRAVPGTSPLNGAQGMQIIEVLPGTPAQAVGLIPGDVVVSIDNGAQLILTNNPYVFRSTITGSGGGRTITMEIHTPYGPWQVIATLGGEMVVTTAAPQTGAPVKSKQKVQTKMKAKQARPGPGGAGLQGGPGAKVKGAPQVPPSKGTPRPGPTGSSGSPPN